jgi:hypothetical protein
MDEDFSYTETINKLVARCFAFSYFGSIYLKQMIKESKLDVKIQVKRFVLECYKYTEPQTGYMKHHYYIEIKLPTRKMIIDNMKSYSIEWFKDLFHPYGTTEKVGWRLINDVVKYGGKLDIEKEVKNMIKYYWIGFINKPYNFPITKVFSSQEHLENKD